MYTHTYTHMQHTQLTIVDRARIVTCFLGCFDLAAYQQHTYSMRIYHIFREL